MYAFAGGGRYGAFSTQEIRMEPALPNLRFPSA